jgi:ABC-type transport system involved in multi-copper enzyme maturation permease subunit
MPDLRLIRAEILKLRRRRGLLVATAVLTFGAVAIYYAIVTGLHVADPTKHGTAGGSDGFGAAMALLAMSAAIAGVIVDATAGGADIEAGVFRDLAATGRSRTALFLSRVPGAWAIVVSAVLVAITLSAILALALHGDAPLTAGAAIAGGASALVAGMLLSAASVGLAALDGSRGMVIGVVLAFQLGLCRSSRRSARLVMRATRSRRWRPRASAATSPTSSRSASRSSSLAWAALTLAAGLWRTRSQEI